MTCKKPSGFRREKVSVSIVSGSNASAARFLILVDAYTIRATRISPGIRISITSHRRTGSPSYRGKLPARGVDIAPARCSNVGRDAQRFENALEPRNLLGFGRMIIKPGRRIVGDQVYLHTTEIIPLQEIC